MGAKRKSYSQLIKELNDCHERIMSLRADPNRKGSLIGARDIMDCFRRSSEPDVVLDPNDETLHRKGVGLLASYVRKGYLRYIPHNHGGLGYEVNQTYLRGENSVVTRVVDPARNLLSKLNDEYRTPMSFLTHINELAPSTSISALMEMLKTPDAEKYLDMLFNKPKEVESLAAQIEPVLSDIHLKHIKFAGGNECQLNDCTLWQAYRIGSAIETMPKASSIMTNSTEEGTIDESAADEKPF